jgi:hypothetical protein
MGVTREDFIRSGRYLEISDAEWEAELASRKHVVGCYMKNDTWAIGINKRVGILLTSSSYGRPYLKASVETWKKLGFWLVLSYDNFIDPEISGDIDYNNWLPQRDVMINVDTFLLTHHQCWGGVSYPYMWQLRLASGIFRNFEYVLCVNGDCIIEKPEGFPELLSLLGDADIMSSGPMLEREIGTAGLLMRTDAFFKISKHLIDHVVPFEEYEKSTQDFGNTEGRLAVAVRELGLKKIEVEPPYNEQLHIPGHGTWWNILGFRHIHGEMNYSYRYKHPPVTPFYQYLDERFLGDSDKRYLKIYEETKDPEILKDWYAKD